MSFGFSSLPLRVAKICAFMVKNLLGFLLVMVLMRSCGEYQKLLKSNDSNAMYKKAIEYYNQGDYTRALSLFDAIALMFTGTGKSQTIAYYRAYCNYNQKNYNLAAELFKQFVGRYPESSYVEECLYMMGYCNYLLSPNPRLDQATTNQAINDFQLYLGRYPNSARKEEINSYLNVLQDKLAHKDFLGAKNYYLRGHYTSAVVCLENCLKDYPGTKHKEEIMYMLFNSKYEMAVNSIEEKQYERFSAAKEEYYYFIDEYPQSRYAADMSKKYEVINNYLKQFDAESE